MEKENEKAEGAERKLPIIIQLAKPIETGDGEPLTKVCILREPKGSDWSEFPVQNQTILDFQKVGARLANLPLPIIKRLDSKATLELVEVVSSFLV